MRPASKRTIRPTVLLGHELRAVQRPPQPLGIHHHNLSAERHDVRKTTPTGRRSRQSGAALITSLLLLLVLTVLGVVMMQTSRMQERMAGNTRDLNMALQGAEAGLRYGEAMISAASSAPFGTAAPCTVCQQCVLPVAMYDLSQFNWLTDPSAQTYGAGDSRQQISQQANGLGLQDNPKYTVEYVNRVRDDLSPDCQRRRLLPGYELLDWCQRLGQRCCAEHVWPPRSSSSASQTG